MQHNEHMAPLQVLGGGGTVETPPPPQKKQVKALYDYKGKTSRELNIKKGSVMVLVNSSNKVRGHHGVGQL